MPRRRRRPASVRSRLGRDVRAHHERACVAEAAEKEWRWSGTHYHRTTQDWLANFDVHHDAIEKILREVYGEETGLWMCRWCLSFLATAGLFGYADGNEWGVSQSWMRAT